MGIGPMLAKGTYSRAPGSRRESWSSVKKMIKFARSTFGVGATVGLAVGDAAGAGEGAPPEAPVGEAEGVEEGVEERIEKGVEEGALEGLPADSLESDVGASVGA